MTRPTKPGARLSFRASHAENKRAIQSALSNLAAASGMPTPAEQLSIATAKPRRAPNKPRSPDDEPLEHAEQCAVISWWHHYSKTKQLDHRLLVAVPNSQALLKFANNPAAFINYMKAEGMRVGMLDLVLFVARGCFNGKIIEMKRKTKGVVSDEQREMLWLLSGQGYDTQICHGADEAIAAITQYIEG